MVSSFQIMGVLNITPNSFSDGGNFLNSEKALKQAKKMIDEGVDILDIGAESTAPNTLPISAKEEWNRLSPILPNLIGLTQKKKIPISLDTSKSVIAQKALEMGVDIINDVWSFRDSHMPSVIASHPSAKIILMFSKEESSFHNQSPTNIIENISHFWKNRITRAKQAGIKEKNIILDPGMGGFLSPDPEVSFAVLRNLETLKEEFSPYKILVGTWRKSFLREVSHPSDPKKRLIASLVSSLIAAKNGADILRVHDVAEMVETRKTWEMRKK